MKYPIKLTFLSEFIIALLIIASFVLGFYFYNAFPEQVISHWNFAGNPDGYSSRMFGAFGIPFMMVGIYFLFLVLPFLDPKKDRYEEFTKVYNIFRIMILTLLLAIFIVMGMVNLGYNISVNHTIPVFIGIFMIVLGNFMGKIKNNWFIGVRTPWTLSSENVWNKTHRFAGYMFTIFGILLIISGFVSSTLSLVFLIVGVLLVSIGTMAYSYIEYKKENKEQIQ